MRWWGRRSVGFCGRENLAALNLFLNQPSAECVFQDYDTFLEGARDMGGVKMVIPSRLLP